MGEREAAASKRPAPAAEPRRPKAAPERVGDDVLLFRYHNTGPCTRFVLKEAFD
jgi:hypothetical protein